MLLGGHVPTASKQCNIANTNRAEYVFSWYKYLFGDLHKVLPSLERYFCWVFSSSPNGPFKFELFPGLDGVMVTFWMVQPFWTGSLGSCKCPTPDSLFVDEHTLPFFACFLKNALCFLDLFGGALSWFFAPEFRFLRCGLLGRLECACRWNSLFCGLATQLKYAELMTAVPNPTIYFTNLRGRVNASKSFWDFRSETWSSFSS